MVYIEYPLPLPVSRQKEGAEKNVALGARFKKRGGGGGGAGQWVAKFSEGIRSSRTTMFFCKRVVSVTTLLFIIHITAHNLISLT